MTIDSSLCIVPPYHRKISTNPLRYWNRDPGNCTCQPNLKQICSISIQNNQIKFRNLVLENKIVSSIQNVDGRISNKDLYNYYAKGYKNPNTINKTFAIQNTRNYTNPNTLNLNIIKKNNQPVILTCK